MTSPDAEQAAVRRAVRLLNGVAALRGAVFIVPVIVPYFADRIGLDFRAFLASEAVFAFTVLVMEVPSGWFADVWRRKSAIALGGAVSAWGMSVLLWADSFATVLVGQVSMGIGISLVSGADTALLYDTLLRHRREGEFRRLEGRRHGVALGSVGLSAIAGGLLYELDPTWPVIATTAAFAGVAVCALAVAEPPRRLRQLPATGLAPLSAGTADGGRGVLLILMVSAVLFGATTVGLWAQQAYYQALHLPPVAFGLLMAAGTLSGAAAGWFGHHLDARIGPVRALATLWLTLIVAWAIAGTAVSWQAVPALLAGGLVWGAGWPLLQSLLNDRVGPARRATMLSTAGLAIRLGFIPLSTAVGWLTDSFGIGPGVLAMAAWLAAGGGALLLLLRLRRPLPLAP